MKMENTGPRAELEVLPFEMDGSFSYVDLIAKADDRFVIAGYASFDEVDKQNERITLKALDEAFTRMMKVPERRNLMLHHTNIQIGRLLPKYKDSVGKTYKAGTDDRGLFIIAELFNDVQKSKDIQKEMLKGHYLSFSVGGQALKRKTSCDDRTCWSDIVKLDLHEVTSCIRGVNPSAKGFILKSGNFKDVAELPGSDSLIKDPSPEASEEKIMSENKDMNTAEPKPEVEKSDLQVLLEAIKELQSSMEKGISVSVKHEMEKAAPEPVVASVPEPAPEPVKPEPGLTKVDVEALFNELLTSKVDELKEALEQEDKPDEKPDEPKPVKADPVHYYKKPNKEDFEDDAEYKKAEDAWNELRTEMTKEIKESMGEVITKSPDPPQTAPDDMNVGKLFEKLDDYVDFKDLLRKEGIEI